jgi:hypothetical protein
MESNEGLSYAIQRSYKHFVSMFLNEQIFIDYEQLFNILKYIFKGVTIVYRQHVRLIQGDSKYFGQSRLLRR